MEIDNSNSNSSFSTQNGQVISIVDSESNDSNENELSKSNSGSQQNMTELLRTAQQESLSFDQNVPDDQVTSELKKLSLDQNGTFMADFDPEKSKREMRKMNRRLYKNSKRGYLYDERGFLLENSWDLCDCLNKNCQGCHFPCPKCASPKCGNDCRCNRKYIVDLIEIEGTDVIYSFPE
ncbi:ARL14 effector protein [Biomphalaria pfeifferi]|uniref:ARL14 effector protein n=1 Tax=Biomphalaria pfeifferi TaxID=112525 RepID=A0AAD8FDV9_BIOPF|nr:ARL14 effector protein [Biomphalaria pfeifferi]